ncbi:esterase/lipase family protein [Leucobacter komagatae]|nr:alpha/beta hydrolase [Leucobacter komagatae]
MSHLRRAGFWAADYAYAGLWQARAFLSRQDPGEFASGSERPVLILPGVYENWRFMLPIIRDLHGRGHPVHIVESLGHNRAPVVDGARIVDDYLAEAGLRDVVIVAHSKGGLLGKQLMTFGESATRIRAMLAAATPFAGSRYARFMLNSTLRSFSPGNETLTALARSLDVNERIVSVFPSFDPHIPEGSVLEGASNVRVQTAGHFRVLADPRTLAEARRLAFGHLPNAQSV